jgi:hypothetical protein
VQEADATTCKSLCLIALVKSKGQRFKHKWKGSVSYLEHNDIDGPAIRSKDHDKASLQFSFRGRCPLVLLTPQLHRTSECTWRSYSVVQTSSIDQMIYT